MDTRIDSVRRVGVAGRVPGRVCLLVMRPLDEDVRARRSLVALQQAGYAVEVVDTVVASGGWGCNHVFTQAGLSLWHIETPHWRLARRRSWLCSVQACWWMVLLCLCSLRRLLQLPGDCYHACELSALPVCYLAACLRRKPLIYEAYEMPLHDIPAAAQTWQRRCWCFVLRLLLPRMLARCAALITVSPPIVSWLRQRYHHPYVVLVRNIPPSCSVPRGNLLRDRLRLPPQIRIALYQGYLQSDRDLERLVYASAYLAPGIVVVLMGKDCDGTSTYLEALIAARKLGERIKILPPVPYAELLQWSASADIGLVLTPARTTLNMYYSLPNKLFEYIMAGLPALATPLPAFTGIIERYPVGRLLSSMEADARTIADAITTMITDEAALDIYRQHAFHAAHEYCWEREQEQLLKVYRHVLDMRSH